MTKTQITKHSFDLEERTLEFAEIELKKIFSSIAKEVFLVWLLIIGIWNLFDVWCLVIGI